MILGHMGDKVSCRVMETFTPVDEQAVARSDLDAWRRTERLIFKGTVDTLRQWTSLFAPSLFALLDCVARLYVQPRSQVFT